MRSRLNSEVTILDKEIVNSMLPNTKYIWCLHCNQVDMKTGWLHNYGYCPYEKCNGTILDALAWTKIQKENPTYPKIPEYDWIYPMYG